MRCSEFHLTHAACHPFAVKLRRPCALAMALWVLGGNAQAQPAPNHLESVVISGSGSERRAFETPYAVSVVEAAELRSAGPMVNLSESLSRVPGIVANLRNNYAQDLQLSSRGFGARATFGIRGLRLPGVLAGVELCRLRRRLVGVGVELRTRQAQRVLRRLIHAVQQQRQRVLLADPA